MKEKEIDFGKPEQIGLGNLIKKHTKFLRVVAVLPKRLESATPWE